MSNEASQQELEQPGEDGKIWVEITSIRLKPDNTRLHGDRNISDIRGSLNRFRQQTPIVVCPRTREILKGNGTYVSARENGEAQIWVVWTDIEDTNEQNAYSIADNKTSDSSAWNEEQLGDTLMQLEETGDMDLLYATGFNEDEVNRVRERRNAREQEPPEAQENRAEELQQQWQTELGQVWNMTDINGRAHVLIIGDSRSDEVGEALAMHAPTINAVISSPPYWNQREYSSWDTFEDYMADMRLIWQMAYARLIDGGVLFWNIGDDSQNNKHISAHHSLDIEAAGFRYIDSIVWRRPGVNGIRMTHIATHRRYYPGVSFEPLLVFQKGDFPLVQFDEEDEGQLPISNVWEIHVENTLSDLHSAPFPIAIPETATRCYTARDGVVLDPFIGSGTTILAASRANRYGVGIEISPEYAAVVLQRCSDSGMNCAKFDG